MFRGPTRRAGRVRMIQTTLAGKKIPRETKIWRQTMIPMSYCRKVRKCDPRPRCQHCRRLEASCYKEQFLHWATERRFKHYVKNHIWKGKPYRPSMAMMRHGIRDLLKEAIKRSCKKTLTGELPYCLEAGIREIDFLDRDREDHFQPHYSYASIGGWRFSQSENEIFKFG